jgi:hypothetical protein
MYEQENSQKVSQQDKVDLLIKQMSQIQNELSILQKQGGLSDLV